MKKTLLCILSFALLGYAQAQFGFFASAVYIHANDTTQFYSTYDQKPDQDAIGNLNFQGADLGTYVENSDSLYMPGGQVKIYKNTNGDVCSVDMYYTIYPVGNRPASPLFQNVVLPFYDNCSGTFFPTGGRCMAGDQKWQSVSQTIDLTTLPIGTYTLEIYYQVNGSNDANCGDAIAYDNNNSNPTNYTSSFTIASIITPVILQSFTATPYSNAVLLKWIDDQELGTKGFEIERSTDGKNFTPIGLQQSKGNSSTANIYAYTDNSLPKVAKVFYRLKIIDQDGNSNYSHVVPVNLSTLAAPLTVQLNANDLMLHATGLQPGTYAVELYSIDGKLFNKAALNISGVGNSTVQNISIAVNSLAKGMYAIIVRNEAGKIAARTSFIK